MKKEIVKEAVRLIISGAMNVILYMAGALIAEYVLGLEATTIKALVLLGMTGAMNYLVCRKIIVYVCGWINRNFN